MILVPGDRELQMARRLLHTSRAHMESCLFRELKKSLPHVSYASSPLRLCLRPPSFCISPTPSISLIPQAGVGPPVETLVQGIVLSFCFVLFFPPFPSSFQALFTEVAYLKDCPEGKCTLMQLLLPCPRSQCCLAPALPAGPAAGFVCQSV